MTAVIAACDRTPFDTFPNRADLLGSGKISTAQVVHGVRRPVLFSMHRLESGATVSWQNPTRDHVVVIWEGRAIIGQKESLSTDDVLIVEHGARVTLHCEGSRTVLLHFECSSSGVLPNKAGGNYHLIRKTDVRAGKDLAKSETFHELYADSGCPTCEVWLHASHFPRLYQGSLHSHTEDEIILVTNGEMCVGSARYGRGTALAIDANTIYTFKGGDNGLSFLNFRPSHPFYISATGEKIDEMRYMLDVVSNGRLRLPTGSTSSSSTTS
jgi:hypothetical protein